MELGSILCGLGVGAAGDGVGGSQGRADREFHATRHIPANSIVHLRAVVHAQQPELRGRDRDRRHRTRSGRSISAILYKLNPALREKYQALFAATLEEAEQLLDDWHKQRESKVKQDDDHSGN